MMYSLRVLMIEDRAWDAKLLLHELREVGFVPDWRLVQTESDYLAHLEPSLDLILADYTLPQFGALRALTLLLDRGLDIPFIIVSGSIGQEIAVEAMRQGATDYLPRDRLARLGPAVTRALEQRRLRQERRQIEVTMVEKAALNQAVLRSLPAHIAVLDKTGTIIAVNNTWVQYLDSKNGLMLPRAIIGVNYLELCRTLADSSPTVAAMLAGLHDVLAGVQSSFLLEYADHRELDAGWTAVHVTPLRDLGGAVIAYEDITERKRLEAQYLHAQKMESVGRLASGIAHDFNNLLTAITGYAELGLMDLPDPSVRSNFNEIIDVAMRASTLTRQLLAFTRQQIVELQLLDLNALIMDISRLLWRLIGENIDLKTQATPDLGLVKADPGQIEQVLVNLVVNARDAMPGGGTVVIETNNVELYPGDAGLHNDASPSNYVLFAVRDTGAGMDDAVKQRAFEPFFTTKQPGLGTGLGLATCYEIVKQSGGHIQIESVIDQGTSINVFLPRIEGVLDAPPMQVPDTPAPLPPGTETILLVEDDWAVRSIAGRVLHDRGYTVLEASNGDDALDIVRLYTDGPIDLLLVDVVMPRFDGRALTERVLALYPSARVLFMSGYTANLALQHGWLPQGAEFLQKPFSPQALAQKVRAVLDAAEL
jgi:two-component system, cell cycle sensor histidine kinase and response regulator CckA